MIVVCWQACRGTRREFAAAMNKGCHDVGLREQRLGYYRSWVCWYFTMLPWFGVLVLCWCWQCLLTFGANLLVHIVTILDVTAVAWCYRHTQDVLHPAECPPGTLQTSVWQWTASVLTTWYSKGNFCTLCAEDWCLHHYLTLWLGC
jgi:hypothetical protein